MNEHESEVFLKELLIAFPAFKSVAEKHSPDFERTKGSWKVAWRDLTLGECREALRVLILEGGITYENLQQPGPFVRRLVLESRKAGAQSEADRAAGVDRERSLASRRDYKGSPMAAAVVKAIEMRKAGATEDVILKSIDAAFPKTDDLDGPRYRCLLCRDRGLVQVVRMDTMRRVESLDLPAESVTHAMTYMVACTCGSGQGVTERKPMRQSGNLPRFDPKNFCRWIDDGGDAERITKWLSGRRPKNYDDSFERWAG